MAPPSLQPVLDWQHGEQGRVIYDCEPYTIIGGGFCILTLLLTTGPTVPTMIESAEPPISRSMIKVPRSHSRL